MRTRGAAVLLLPALTLVGGPYPTAVTEAAQDEAFWPQFHGPLRNNVSNETGLLKEWPEGGPKLLWTAGGLGHGYSTVSIADGRIYTAGNLDGKTVVTAMDTRGEVLWRAENGQAWTGDRPGTRGTPTIDGDRVYHESPHGDVICLETATGERVWGLNILEKFGSQNIFWALSESLLVDGDHVICCPGGPKASVVALDKYTGEVVWEAPSTGDLAGYASPVLAEHDGRRMILTLTLKAVIGVNADTGDLLFRMGHESYADENILAPIYYEGHLIVSSLAVGTVKWELDVADGKVSLTEVWRSNELDHHHGGVVLVDGYLYGTGAAFNQGKWICLDVTTGERTYAEVGVGKGSLTYADGMLYTLGEQGTVGLVPATPTEHKVVSQFSLPAGGEGPAWAHPVVCGGRLYLRHGEFLYAYDVQGEPSGTGEEVRLFNGEDLSGWEHFLVDGNARMEDVWSVEGGILVCRGEPGGYLCTKDTYESFRLTVEWRWPGEPGNSGVLMRITGEPTMLPNCVEAQLQNGNAGDMYGFQGFRIDGDKGRRFDAPDVAGGLCGLRKIEGNENKPGEWNTYEITVDGDRITLVVNDKTVNEATGCDVRPGKVGLQSEGGIIQFRTVTLTPPEAE
jgi:outer membrane protein assembly factor BamB